MFSWGSSGDKDSNKYIEKAQKPSKEDVDKIFETPKDASKKNFDGFDPTGLERAAKAARELQDLKYASEAILIAKEQESTKRKEYEKEIETNKTRQKEVEAAKIRIQEEERRKSMENEHNFKNQQAQYQDQLARQRYNDQMNAQRKMKDEEIQKMEDSQRRMEALKRQTAEYEARIRKETEVARAQAESEGKIEQERKNFDLHMKKAAMEQVEFRKTVLEGIKEAGSIIGNGVSGFLEDREKLATAVGTVTLAALGIYTARAATRVAGSLIERRLSQPPLVRETSRMSFSNLIQRPFSTISRKLSLSNTDAKKVMENIVLESSVKNRLERFVTSTANGVRNNAPFRNMLLHGPPGTGKTLFAKQLAHRVNMNYAILAGSDVLPLGKQGVAEIHKLFDWAEHSSKGLVLFVDEAETFLRARSKDNMSEEARNALNAFLYRTGTASNKFMVIFASNQPENLDWAVNDRTDELVEFKLPALSERFDMLKLYFDRFIKNGHLARSGTFTSRPKEITVEAGVDDKFLEEISKKIEDFSGREINKLVIAWQAHARGSVNCSLTQKEMLDIVQQRIDQHNRRKLWEKSQS